MRSDGVLPPSFITRCANTRAASTYATSFIRSSACNGVFVITGRPMWYSRAARVFAQRVMKEGGKTPSERIAYAFRVAPARFPKPAESTILLDAFRQKLDQITSKP